MYKFHYIDGEVHTVVEVTMMFAYYRTMVHRRGKNKTTELEFITYKGKEYGLSEDAEFVLLD